MIVVNIRILYSGSDKRDSRSHGLQDPYVLQSSGRLFKWDSLVVMLGFSEDLVSRPIMGALWSMVQRVCGDTKWIYYVN